MQIAEIQAVMTSKAECIPKQTCVFILNDLLEQCKKSLSITEKSLSQIKSSPYSSIQFDKVALDKAITTYINDEHTILSSTETFTQSLTYNPHIYSKQECLEKINKFVPYAAKKIELLNNINKLVYDA